MHESLGQLVDRLSSLEVDHWHAAAGLNDPDLSVDHRARLATLRDRIEGERRALTGRIQQVWNAARQ